MRRAFGDRWPLTVGVMAVIAVVLAVLALTGDDEGTAEAPPSAPEVTPSPSEVTPRPTVETSTPTPDDLPTFEPPTPTPTVPEEELALQALRESAAWVNLAEWDRALTGRRLFQIYNEIGAVAEFTNAEELWNEAIPPLREELLLMARDEGIEPESVRFRGLPVEDSNVAGVIRWFTNARTQGRGMMFVAYAAYLTVEGESRYRAWPLLISTPSQEDPWVGDYGGTGPAIDLANNDLPPSTDEIDAVMGPLFLDWLRAQPAVMSANDPACPDDGCAR